MLFDLYMKCFYILYTICLRLKFFTIACLGGETMTVKEMKDANRDPVQGEDLSTGQGLDLVRAQKGWLRYHFLNSSMHQHYQY